MASRKIRVAVIGAGNMGRNHVRNYRLLPEAELVAVADVDPKTKSLADEHGARHFIDYRLMLKESKPEAVSIVVPTPYHSEVATEVMSQGIHCLLEKPISSTVKEADQLISLSKKMQTVFTVGHLEHYNPIVRKIKQMLDEKELGTVTSVICKRVGGFPAVEPKTDVIIDLAVHDIGIISHLLGLKPKKLYSHGSRTHHSEKIDSAEILIDYGQASGFVQANWLTPVKIRTIAVTGSQGYLEGNYITQKLVFYKHNMQKPDNARSFTNFVITMGQPEEEVVKVDFKEPLTVELKRFLSHIRGNQTEHLVEPYAAREALRLALEAVKPYENIGKA